MHLLNDFPELHSRDLKFDVRVVFISIYPDEAHSQRQSLFVGLYPQIRRRGETPEGGKNRSGEMRALKPARNLLPLALDRFDDLTDFGTV